MNDARIRRTLMSMFASACLLLVPNAVSAGTLNVYPANFSNGGNPDGRILPDYVKATASPVQFWAYVKLPNGATVTRLEYRGMGTGAPGSVVNLMRHRPGMDVPESVGTAINSGTAGSWTTFATPPFSSKINTAYKYFLHVTVAPDNMVGFIKITYKQ